MSKKADKMKMVQMGKIEDMRIFKLMYLEKSISETKLLAELKKRAFNDQIEQLKTERQNQTRAFDLRARTLTDQVTQIRSAFEEDYEIKLTEWGYDDATGILVSLHPEELKAVRSRASLQKAFDSKKSEEKKQRVSRKKKTKLAAVEEPQPDPVEEDAQKPPTEVVEA